MIAVNSDGADTQTHIYDKEQWHNKCDITDRQTSDDRINVVSLTPVKERRESVDWWCKDEVSQRNISPATQYTAAYYQWLIVQLHNTQQPTTSD